MKSFRNSKFCSPHAAEEKRHSINQDEDCQQYKIEAGGGDADDREWLAPIFFRLVLDLNQLVDAQGDSHGTGNRTEITTPANCDRKDTADHRPDCESLLRRLHIVRRRWRLPTARHRKGLKLTRSQTSGRRRQVCRWRRRGELPRTGTT